MRLDTYKTIKSSLVSITQVDVRKGSSSLQIEECTNELPNTCQATIYDVTPGDTVCERFMRSTKVFEVPADLRDQSFYLNFKQAQDVKVSVSELTHMETTIKSLEINPQASDKEGFSRYEIKATVLTGANPCSAEEMVPSFQSVIEGNELVVTAIKSYPVIKEQVLCTMELRKVYKTISQVFEVQDDQVDQIRVQNVDQFAVVIYTRIKSRRVKSLLKKSKLVWRKNKMPR